MKRYLLLAGILLAAIGSGCTSESGRPEATGKGVVRAINTISTSPSMLFLIEERQIESVAFKSATSAGQWDDLEYTFNFAVVLPGDTTRTRVASEFLDVIADRDYTFVISGSIAAPAITVWEKAVRSFAESDAVFEARFAHTAPALGSIDVYFAAPGVPPALGQEAGTLAFGDILDPVDYPEGEYVLFYTTAGDPADILFESNTLAPNARTAITITTFDTDANDLGTVAVRLIDSAGGTFNIGDTTIAPTVQYVQASMALATADIYIDDPLTTPAVVSDHAFGDITADVPAVAGPVSLTYTTPGDTSAILFEDDITLSQGVRSRFFVIGASDSLSGFVVTPDRRSVETLVNFSITHAAVNHPAVNIYVVNADAGIGESTPLFNNLPFGNLPVRSSFAAGSYDVFVTARDEAQTILAGPLRLDAELGDVYDVLVIDTVDPATAELVTIP